MPFFKSDGERLMWLDLTGDSRAKWNEREST